MNVFHLSTFISQERIGSIELEDSTDGRGLVYLFVSVEFRRLHFSLGIAHRWFINIAR